MSKTTLQTQYEQLVAAYNQLRKLKTDEIVEATENLQKTQAELQEATENKIIFDGDVSSFVEKYKPLMKLDWIREKEVHYYNLSRDYTSQYEYIIDLDKLSQHKSWKQALSKIQELYETSEEESLKKQVSDLKSTVLKLKNELYNNEQKIERLEKELKEAQTTKPKNIFGL